MALRADDVDLGRDRALVEQYQEGDIAAFEDLYRRYYGRLLRFCIRRTGDHHEAEEVVQEAFTRAYRAMPALRGERRFYPWLSVIASRLCVDSHRRLGRTEPTAEIDLGATEAGPDRLEAAVDFDLLDQALRRLSARHREVLDLREREGWSYQRIADHYGISLGAVEGLLFRARQALRREFLALAGPEGGLAAALPPVAALGWLARRLAGVRGRFARAANGWANLPALTANGVGLAMVATTAAGLDSAAVGVTTPPPIHVATAPAAVVGTALADAPRAVPADAPAETTPTTAARTPANPAPAAPAKSIVPVDVPDHYETPTGTDFYGAGAAERAEDNPLAAATPDGLVAAGADPGAAAADALDYLYNDKEPQP